MEMEIKQFRSKGEDGMAVIPEGCEKTPAKRRRIGMRRVCFRSIFTTENNSQSRTQG